MRYLNFLGLIILAFITTSCFEEDQHVDPIPIDEVSIPYSIYEYQTYISLTDVSIVSYHSFTDWDLGFESSDEGYHIILNSARYMYAGNTYEKGFYDVKSNIADEMLFDHSSGNLDSTVLKDWADYSDPLNPIFSSDVYIIDRGKNEAGEDFGFKKIIFEKLENDTFYVHFANLDNTEEYYCKVPKDPKANFTLFSLESGQILVSEPDKSAWDICLTKYSTIIPDDFGTPTDYLVRGALLNPYKNIEVGLDTENYFYDIQPEMIDNYSYSATLDAIGYAWKDFSSELNAYKIRDYNTYILKNVNGLNYKLRFTDFYKDGEKGYPAFELVELTIN